MKELRAVASIFSIVLICTAVWSASKADGVPAVIPEVTGSLEPCRNATLLQRSNKKAFATILTTGDPCYNLALGVLLASFAHTNSAFDFLVLHERGALIDQGLRIPGVRFIPVSMLTDSAVNPRLSSMATKFQLWRFCQFSQIAYFDADHIFTANADSIFEECGEESILCGVGDSSPNGKREGQFNAGTMVLHPSLELSEELLSAYRTRHEWMNVKDLVRSGDQGKTFFVGFSIRFTRCSRFTPPPLFFLLSVHEPLLSVTVENPP
jgi:hypothetical protein